MARKKTTQTPEDKTAVADTQAIQKAVDANDMLASLEREYDSDRDIANQLSGRIGLSLAITKLLTVQQLMDLQTIKNNKIYKHLVNSEDAKTAGISSFHTWESFCISKGFSRQHIDEQLLNLKTLGPEALDKLNEAGIGFLNIRKLRVLPDSERAVVINDIEINVGDKKAIVSLIEDQMAKSEKEKKQLQKTIADQESTIEAKAKLLSDKDKKLNKYHEQLHSKKTQKWDRRVTEYNIEVSAAATALLSASDQLKVLKDTFLNEDFGEENEAATEMMAVVYYDAINQIVGDIIHLRDQCDAVFSGYKDSANHMIGEL